LFPIQQEVEYGSHAGADEVVVDANCNRFTVIKGFHVNISGFKRQGATKQKQQSFESQQKVYKKNRIA